LELDTSGRGSGNGTIGGFQIERDRFLAEDLFPGSSGRFD
jgi:hypothetical protein